jgi:hypothetical protein
MRKFYLCTLSVFFFISYASSQTTVVLQPDSATGMDAMISDYYPSTPNGFTPEFNAAGWTINSTPVIQRSLINFDLSVVPSNATIQTAHLTLYNDPNSLSGFANGTHSHVSGSNAALLQRITSSWQQNTVTWNIQPTTTALNEVSLLQDTNPNEDYTMDVKLLVIDMINNPSTSFGFFLREQNENYYRILVFASSNHQDSTIHPKLVITYTLNGPPPTTNFQSSGTEFCGEGGACVNFFDSSTGNPTSWHWILNGAVPDSSNQQNPDSICYYQPGTYPVTLITGNAYGYDTLTVPAMIILEQLPPAPVVTVVGGDTLICSHATHYQWFLNGSPIFGAIDSFYVAHQPGTYSVQVGDFIGCSRISNGVLITGLTPDLFSVDRGVEIFPNPCHDEFTVFTSEIMINATIGIYNPLGIRFYEERFTTGSQWKIHCKLSPRIYFVQIQSEKGKFVKRICVD